MAFGWSAFAFGGLFGFAVGPLAVVGLVAVVGLGGMWIAMIPAIGVCGVLLMVLPGGSAPIPTRRLRRDPMEMLRTLRGPLGVIFGISALSGFIQRLFHDPVTDHLFPGRRLRSDRPP